MAVNSVTPAQQADITALYAAFWNRAPDTTGFGFWVQAYANGASLSSIATQFRADPEGVAAYPLASTNVQLITEVYQNVFDRAPDAGGLAFWVNALNTMTFPDVVISMVQAALKPGNDDGQLFVNKVKVGEYVAITVETDNYNVTSHAFDLVTADPASVTEAEFWVDTQVTGATYTLTTSADIATAQYFDGSLNSFGQETLNNFDQLTGSTGKTNKLDAQLASNTSYVTPELLKNIQIVDVTALGAANTNQTLDLRNADAVEVVVNDGSIANLIFNNVGGTLTDIAVNNTAADTTVNLAAAADLTEINLNVSNVLDSAGNGANISIPTAETININSHTLASSIDLVATSANTITIGGDADLTVGSLNAAGTTSVESIDASLFEGDLDITLGAQSQVLTTTVITVNSGLGNDTIDMTGVTQKYTVTLGAGNDTLIDTGITATDSVQGGLGEDALLTAYATAAAISSVNGINGIDTLGVEVLGGGTLTVANVDSTITALEVANGVTALTSAATTVVGSAGSFLVELGATAGTALIANVGDLGHAVTFTDTGSATTDTLNIVNLAVQANSNTNLDVFQGNNVTSNGYENVVIDTGVASPTQQTIGTLTITADSASAPVSVTLTGNSGVTIAQTSSNTTGSFTVDASGLNVLTTATGLVFNLPAAPTYGLGATQSIIGSAGQDNIALDYSGSVYGGTGNDTLSAFDQLATGVTNQLVSGDAGNDIINGGAGNDTLLGGIGNDTVNVGINLSSADVVDGGEGVDTLSVGAAITGTTGVGVVNFEVLQTTVDQVMTNTINNSGWTTVFGDAASVAITNALAAVATYQVDETATTTHSFLRLVDTGTDSLTIASLDNDAAASTSITTFSAVDEESITIDTSAGASTDLNALTIGTLNATDLTSLTLTGDHAVTITNAIVGATGLATVNASGLTAALDVNASTSTTALTFTGSATAANTFVSGTKADVITGGSAADIFTGNAGNDTVNFGSGASVVDVWNFATTGTAAGANATASEIANFVGSDTIASFYATGAVDYFVLDATVFGSNIGDTTAHTLTNFQSVTSATALLAATTNNGIVVVQPTAGNASASIYYVDGSTSAVQNLQYYIDNGNAQLIGTVTSATGVIASTDFYVQA